MRVEISGRPSRQSLLVQFLQHVERPTLHFRGHTAGLAEKESDTLRRNARLDKPSAENPRPNFRPALVPLAELSTTKPGRFCDSLPSISDHAPRLGRPNCVEPVFMKSGPERG